MAILTVLGALALSAFGKLLADEVKAWRPKICDALIKCAAAQLFPFQRERYIEQWRCDVEEIPGDISKLYFAADLIRGTLFARVSSSRKDTMLSAIENSEEMAVHQFVFLAVACWRERSRRMLEEACPCMEANFRKFHEQCQASFLDSLTKTVQEQKRLADGRLSEKVIIARLVQRVAENNAAKLGDYQPPAEKPKCSDL